MGLFGDLFSSQPAKDAAAAQVTGYNNANTTLTNAQGGADQLYQQAYQPFSTLYTKSQPGIDAYADATGANGAEGLARAKANYTADPGYSGGLTTGIDQVMRTANARGDLGGGNTSADEIKFASDYDNQKYGQYVSGLAPWLSEGNTAAAGGAGVLGSEAGADLGVAGNVANNQTGVGNANANAALAPYSASSNFWNALMGGAKLAVSAATGMPTGGGGGPSLAPNMSPGSVFNTGNGQISVGGPMGPTAFS